MKMDLCLVNKEFSLPPGSRCHTLASLVTTHYYLASVHVFPIPQTFYIVYSVYWREIKCHAHGRRARVAGQHNCHIQKPHAWRSVESSHLPGQQLDLRVIVCEVAVFSDRGYRRQNMPSWDYRTQRLAHH